MVVTRNFTSAAVLFAACGFAAVAGGQTFPGQSQGVAPTTSATAPEGESASFWSRIPKPQITWPKIEMPKIAWPELDPAGAANTAFAPLKASAKKVTSGAKRAWEGAKEIFAFGGAGSQPVARTASREQPSVWQRMFGAAEPDPGPQTMDEFMRGSRLQ